MYVNGEDQQGGGLSLLREVQGRRSPLGEELLGVDCLATNKVDEKHLLLALFAGSTLRLLRLRIWEAKTQQRLPKEKGVQQETPRTLNDPPHPPMLWPSPVPAERLVKV